MACPGSLILPRSLVRSQKADDSAAFGTLVHRWAETGECDDETLERKLLLSGTRREKYWPDGSGQHEVAFALQLFTLDLHFWNSEDPPKDAWKKTYDPAKWLTGTMDWWGKLRGESHVDDLKTGHWASAPQDSGQLKSYSLVDFVYSGQKDDWSCITSITQWEKYPLGDKPHRKYHRLGCLDAVEHLESLRYAATHPEEVNPEGIYVGPWDPEIPLSNCAFCDCRVQFPVAAWMGNYKYRAMAHCLPGIMKTLARSEDG